MMPCGQRCTAARMRAAQLKAPWSTTLASDRTGAFKGAPSKALCLSTAGATLLRATLPHGQVNTATA